jgi:2-dehydro-3-deoxygluconokinase
VKKKVLCFGELLLRISPSAKENAASTPFLLYIGGAEANAATALAGWGVPVKYCTALPASFMSEYVINYLEYRGIYTSSVLQTGKRIGVYYLDRGADLKSSVVYDREGYYFAELKPGMIDWDKVLHDVSWFHFTAISPALNQQVADICLEGVKAAAEKNIPVSVDLNYRSRLWKYGKDPKEIMPGLVAYCDLVMGNIWAANTLLGTDVDENIHAKNSKQAYLDHAKATSQEIIQRFPKCSAVANTFRFDSDSNDLLYYTSLFTAGQSYHSADFRCKGVIDRSGSGDCFMAGLMYGFYNHLAPQALLDYATAAAFGKLQEAGDATKQDELTVSNSI